MLEPHGFEVVDTRAGGMDVERGFELAVDTQAVAVVAGPIIRLDRAHQERLRGCRAIVRYGVGLDNVDVAAAADLGIAVGNVPEYGHEEISNHAIALLLALHRRLFQFDGSVRAGGEGVPPIETILGSRSARSGWSGSAASASASPERRRPSTCGCSAPTRGYLRPRPRRSA